MITNIIIGLGLEPKNYHDTICTPAITNAVKKKYVELDKYIRLVGHRTLFFLPPLIIGDL